MNILYINHYAGSPEMGMEFRPYYLSKEWEKMGHNVCIIAGDYSHLRKINPKVSNDMEKQVIDGIDYYWMKTGTYEGNGVKRALSMIRFCYKLCKWKGWISTHINPDVVISSSTYPIDSIPAYSIAVMGNKKSKYIHEIHDMWPATLTEIGGMSKWNPFVLLMQFGENYAYKHADVAVSLLKYARPYMEKHGLKSNGFFHIPNGVVLEEWSNPSALPEKHKEVLEELKEKNKFIVGYFGGHALSNCLMPLLQAAEAMINEKDVHFVLVGDGVEKKSLTKYAEEKNLTNITFLSSINKTAIPLLAEYFDCTYIGAIDSPLYRFGVCMNKMFDGMMAGKPIIFAINAPPTPVEDCGCGLIIKPQDKDELVKAIQRMMNMPPDKRKEMGLKGREEILNKYTYEKLAGDFAIAMSR